MNALRRVSARAEVAGNDDQMSMCGPKLAEGQARAVAARRPQRRLVAAQPGTALEEFDLLASAFGAMFFGDADAAHRLRGPSCMERTVDGARTS